MSELVTDPDIIQFDALPPCEFERAIRYLSGRRSCKFSDIPCGVENPAICGVLLKQKEAKATSASRSLSMRTPLRETPRSKKRRGPVKPAHRYSHPSRRGPARKTREMI